MDARESTVNPYKPSATSGAQATRRATRRGLPIVTGLIYAIFCATALLSSDWLGTTIPTGLILFIHLTILPFDLALGLYIYLGYNAFVPGLFVGCISAFAFAALCHVWVSSGFRHCNALAQDSCGMHNLPQRITHT
ncbi:hypothetical protein CEE69_26615 [Rhodopirellula bahusiensis]|uniref:Uncharacterized protein n=1 Tax=Rhodopirellula bahusiensis TaxID=2014065 RepID=A0A2G1VZW8_9BACT|nr:hypothetical protein CEE69_26615 [Rhodopirellula bahusiensis]